MPFQPLNWRTRDSVEIFPAHLLCYGETVSGDAVFVETERADGRVMLMLLDATGHGAKAAEAIAKLRELLTLPGQADLDPATLMLFLHNLYLPLSSEDVPFVTALAVLVDGRDGRMEAANGGQPHPMIGTPGSSWQAWQLPHNPPLGMPVPMVTYQADSRLLRVGEFLLTFTDGVTEAGVRVKGTQHQFQFVELSKSLNGLPAGLSPERVVGRLLASLRNHVGDDWPEDDTSAFCLRCS